MPAYATQTAPKQTQNSQQQPKKQKAGSAEMALPPCRRARESPRWS